MSDDITQGRPPVARMIVAPENVTPDEIAGAAMYIRDLEHRLGIFIHDEDEMHSIFQDTMDRAMADAFRKSRPVEGDVA